MRLPGGQKVVRYRSAELQKFGPTVRPDGLITRLITYKDPDYTEVHKVKEWFQNRSDHLEQREIDKVDNFTSERFRDGRRFHLLFHKYQSLTMDGIHEMEFSKAHFDNIVRRLVSPGEMTEMFEGRTDFLYYRQVNYSQSVQFSEVDQDSSLLERVVERFHRNRSKAANEDVAERVFLLTERRIDLTFHLEDHRFIPSKTSFIKPQESTEMQKGEDFTADMVKDFQVADSETTLGTMSLYVLLVALMKDEEKVINEIKDSIKAVRDIVSCRQQEEGDIQLAFSPWTRIGAAMVRSQRQGMERQAVEEQPAVQEKDALAPLLLRLGLSDKPSAEDAELLYRECLSALEQRQAKDIELIQKRYEKEYKELQKKRQWYEKNQVNMTPPQREEYYSLCSEKTRRINVAKRRLHYHRETDPQKYHALDQKLRQDSRLASYFRSCP